MDCKKCQMPGTIILRKKDSYCSQCFISNTCHKFRSCIGKNRVLSSNQKVLLGVSGGYGSTVLLELVHEGVSLNNHKILRLTPACVHIVGKTENTDKINAVVKQCNNYGFDVYIVHISDYYQKELKLPEINNIPCINQEAQDEFISKCKKMTLTEKNDFISKIKRKLLIKVAEMLNCSYIFTAETTTTLASNLLSNIAVGRGSQIENDIGFSDFRDAVKILRPMKDISKEELDYYISIKHLSPVLCDEDNGKSLQTLVKKFVVDLQENFQATISTVCKTADKIGSTNYVIKKQCLFCQSNIGVNDSKLTASEATLYSKSVCNGQQAMQLVEDLEEAQNDSAYCYSCGKNQALLV